MIEQYYQPFDAGLPGGAAEQGQISQEVCDAIYQRMDTLRDEYDEKGELYPPEFHSLNLQRRIIARSLKFGSLPTAENITDDLARALSETQHNESAHQKMGELRWAFL